MWRQECCPAKLRCPRTEALWHSILQETSQDICENCRESGWTNSVIWARPLSSWETEDICRLKPGARSGCFWADGWDFVRHESAGLRQHEWITFSCVWSQQAHDHDYHRCTANSCDVHHPGVVCHSIVLATTAFVHLCPLHHHQHPLGMVPPVPDCIC